MANIFDTYKTIAMLGKSGCGKGTQAKLLSEQTGFKVFSVGNRFRELGAEDTPLGRRLKATIDGGHLAPSWLAMYLFKESTLRLPSEEGIIYEGTNRKPLEAEVFHDVMSWLERPYKAVYFDISDEEVLKRLSIRGMLGHRQDDNEEGVRERLGWFHTETIKVIELFRSKGTLIEVNGEQDEKAVFEEMMTKLEAAS